jgi:acyl-coenzyme A synthetase/AMP-(fatty) acid ligase
MELPATWVTAAVAERYESAGLWTTETWVDDFLAWHATDPSAAAVTDDSGVSWTVGEVMEGGRRLAGWLWAQGVRPGHVVSIVLPNWAEFYVVHAAIGLVGGVVSPISPDLGRTDMRHMLGLAGSRVLVAAAEHRGRNLAKLVEEACEDLAEPPTIVTVRSASGHRLEDILTEEWDAQPGLPATPPLDARGPDVVLFTSGTESSPKGAVHSHQTARFDLCRYVDDVLSLGNDECVFMPSPICHATGLQWGLRTAIHCRALLVLQDRWSADAAVDMVEAHRCTYLLAATPFVAELTEAADRRGTKLDSLRYLVSGGAPIPRQLIGEVGRTLDTEQLCVFGATETYVTTATAPSDPIEVLLSDGRPLPGVEVAIFGADGARVATGVEGEIVTRGPHVFLGYLGDEHLTTSAFWGEWYRFGDVGWLDDLGALHVTGRIKDIVIRGGQNISVREIEEHLRTHPQVGDVAIVGYPDLRLGERCCAFVVPSTGVGVLALDELCSFLLDRGLARYKLPERLELVDRLPMTASGKYRRVELRAKATALHG